MNDGPLDPPALEDAAAISRLKEWFAPDGAAEREHNAASGSLGFGAIHHALVANLKPQRVLVVGSRHGYIPAVIALALRVNGTGVVDFVDANYSDAVHGFAAAWGGVGHWDAEAGRKFEAFGLGGRVRVHIKRSSEFFETCASRFEYVYLDGDHSYEGCRFDFEQAAARTIEGGLIVLHDVCVTEPAFGVMRLFGELDERRYGRILIPAWPGLGIVQVRRSQD